MGVINIHRRTLACSEDEAGRLIDSLSSPDDRLWPADRWPAMRFDRPLAPGARGGHGPVRYEVDCHVPGRWVRFRFTGPRGFHGHHEYWVSQDARPDRCVLQHQLTMRVRGPARLTWPLAFRWLHDALIEDSLDRAESDVSGSSSPAPRWSPFVRVLRSVARVAGLGDRPDGRRTVTTLPTGDRRVEAVLTPPGAPPPDRP